MAVQARDEGSMIQERRSPNGRPPGRFCSGTFRLAMYTCHDCRRRFDEWNSLNQHLKSSARHAGCPRCRRGFGSLRELDGHWSTSHPGLAPSLGGGLGPGEPLAISASDRLIARDVGRRPYDGVPRELVTPVFRAAYKLRFGDPTPEEILAQTGTSLELEIVSAILEAALRLVPADNSDEGILRRREKAAEKARQAAMAESHFIGQLRRIDPRLLTESELHQRFKAAMDAGQEPACRLTPDTMLSQPTVICGKVCNWVEFKNTFGFRSSPFVAQKNKQQFGRYASRLGPGMVVFKLGYETEHVNIRGVYCFREAEVIEWLRLRRR